MTGSVFSLLLKNHLEPMLERHRLPLYQIKTLEAWRRCRTASMGSHSQFCENGHLMGVWHDSCKRRGCPQCQSLPTARWLESQSEVLLKSTHHHWVFTLPHELLPLWRYNRPVLQSLFFKAVADTLKLLAKDLRYLNAQPAFSLTLHTWGRNLSLHPHLHCLIAHGGLGAEKIWREPKKSCLFPARVMMQLYRGKLLAGLRSEDALSLPPDMQPHHLRALLNKLGRLDWVVHCRKPYRHGRGVLSYLSRYVKRGPLSPGQLKLNRDNRVQFFFNSHQTGKRGRHTLDPEAFLYRLCEHIQLPGKPTMRYYGLYHPCKRTDLNIARALLGQKELIPPAKLTWERYLLAMENQPVCRECGAGLKTKARIQNECE